MGGIELQVIPIDKLENDPDVQLSFSFSERHARNIASNWTERKVGHLEVSLLRNGNYGVIDGRHRLFAGKLAGVKEFRCDLHKGTLSIKEKSDIKIGFDRARRVVSTLEYFLIRVKAGELSAVEINRAVQDSGFSIAVTRSSKCGAKAYRCVAMLQDIYNRQGLENLSAALTLNTTWKGDPGTTDATWVLGLSLLARDGYIDKITPRGYENLASLVPMEVSRRAKGQVLRNGGSLGSNDSVAVAYEIATSLRKRANLKPLPAKKGYKDSHSRQI